MTFTKISFVLCLTTFITCLTACHTVQGAGQDISAGGNAIQKSATKNHPQSTTY